jgi:NAD(P)-dependent dehydrogenase (short-subunit alcohol dehydrogenase family)
MQYVVITGGAGGLGGAVAKFMADKGIKVFALDVKQEALDKINNPNIIPVLVNITDPESVKAAVAKVMETTDKLDAVINFAGILYMGSTIETDEALMERILKINVLGMYIINKYFVELVINGKGRIINISSEIGWMSSQPFNSFYATSKHAVEAYSDSLRRELLFLGIPVIKINPGSFKTEMHGAAEQNFKRMLDSTTHFKDVVRRMESLMIGELKHAKSPDILAKAVYKAFIAKRPKIRYKVNNSKKLILLNLFSEKAQDFIYKIAFTKIFK